MSMDQFILFGDSITQHSFSQDIPEGQAEVSGIFGPKLADAYVRRLDVVNRGLSGYNTRQALQVVPQVIPSAKDTRVRFITIFFGANDARLPNTLPGPQQHVPLEEFRENMRAIATHPLLTAHNGVRIVLITPPPVDARANNRIAEVTAEYAKAVRELGIELGLPVLDTWNAMTASTIDLHQFLHDGLHLTRTGYELLFTELMKVIEKTWPDQMPDSLEFVLPRWDDEGAWGEGREATAVL